MTLLYVALGASLGAPLRYVLGHYFDEGLPLGTGFCGALTTYSAFVVQTHDRGPRRGTVIVLLTVVPAFALCTLGFWLGSRA